MSRPSRWTNFLSATALAAAYYKLLKQGTGPRIMKAGVRTLVSAEAERDWHRSLEVQAAVAAA